MIQSSKLKPAMKKLLILSLIFGSVCSLSAQSVTEKLDAYFMAAQKTDKFNGSVLIMQNGQQLLDKGYGVKNFDNKMPADANTVYQIGSVTKQFTSTIILKLAEQNKLALNDKLSKYFPLFPNGNKITIEHLLTHTSGIWNYTRDQKLMSTDVDRPHTPEEMMNLFKDKPLDFEPGAKYSYSNSGYMMLGYIIEKVTGKKYERMVSDQIFVPLKMTHSGFDFTHSTSADKATGYQSLALNSASKAVIVDSTVSFSAGALFATTGDLYKWNQSLSSNKILKKESLANAFTPRNDKYGLGWIIDTFAGRKIITHDGGIHGFLSSNSIFPDDKISIILLSNSNSTKMGDVNGNVFAILFDRPYKLPEVKAQVIVDSLLLQQYVGEYELTPAFKITVSIKDGKFFGQATGQPPFEMFAKNESQFFLKVVDAQVDFFKNDKGEVEKMVLHQNGQDLPGKKIK